MIKLIHVFYVLGTVTNLSGDSVMVKFLQPSVTDGIYRWPSKDDIVDVTVKFVFTIIDDPPIPVSGGRSLRLPNWRKFNTTYEAYKRKYFC